MNDNRILPKLDKRLRHLYEWVDPLNQYDHIWDLCCDHGYLGLHLAKSSQLMHSQIHLVDCVPEIMDRLRKKYTASDYGNIHFHLDDAATMSYEGQSHLVIIAGVGGDTVEKILMGVLTSIHRKVGATLHVLLSPNTNTYAVRQFCWRYNLQLIDELFVTENGRHYEHMFFELVSDKALLNDVIFTGTALWQMFSPAKYRYIEKLVKHYERCQKNTSHPYAQKAKEAYSNILERYTRLY